MTDNRTTELLRKLLDKHGLSYQTHYLHTSWHVGPKLYKAVDNLDGTLTVGSLTPEQAIAATLGNYRVTEDSIDKWLREFQFAHGELAYIGSDELKDLACALHDDIPLGYEASMRLGQWLLHATLGNGTLTAEQVRRTVLKLGNVMGPRFYGNWQAVADELNAELGSGTCEVEYVNEWMGWHCKSCDTLWQGLPDQKPSYCMRCGKAVER